MHLYVFLPPDFPTPRRSNVRHCTPHLVARISAKGSVLAEDPPRIPHGWTKTQTSSETASFLGVHRNPRNSISDESLDENRISWTVHIWVFCVTWPQTLLFRSILAILNLSYKFRRFQTQMLFRSCKENNTSNIPTPRSGLDPRLSV